jgi:hypothetical protein
MSVSPFTSRLKTSLGNAWMNKHNPHKFEGENYYLWAQSAPSDDKKKIEFTLTSAHQAGYKARVLKVKDVYHIYIRRK